MHEIHHTMLDTEYHAAPGISSTTAKLALKSMQLLGDKLRGILPPYDSPAFQVGRLAHMMILEPDRFAEQVVTAGPINEKSGKPYGRDTKAFQDWQALNPGVTVVDPWLHLALDRMPGQVADLLAGGVAEASVFADLASGLRVKCRPDYWRDGELFDLKTCADVDQAEKNIRAYSYWFSHAWYRMTMKQATRSDFSMRLIFVEKAAPHRWRIVSLAPDYVEYADNRCDELVGQISEAVRLDRFDDAGPVEVEASLPKWFAGDEFSVDAEGGISL
jgi:hypothetical protein